MYYATKILLLLFASSLLVLETQCTRILPVSPLQKSPEWVHQFTLDKETGVSVKWKSTQDEDNSQWLTMEIFAPTKGYVSVGFSPHGGMTGSDIVLAWVDSSGTLQIRDLHGIGNEMPVEDSQQDYELLSGKETPEGTTIKFKRRWNTCDDLEDRQITNETIRLIWAYGDKDPETRGSTLKFNYHGQRRGVKSVYMQNEAEIPKFPDDPNDTDPDVKYWDLFMDKNPVDASETTYHCKIIKVPQVDKKHHLIGYRPIVQPENKKYVHHMCMYECVVPEEHGGTANLFEKHLNHPGGKCYTSNMPPDWGKYCSAFTFVWLTGSDGEMLPQHVGIPVGEQHNGATYFMFEIHYDNPEGKTFLDSSGVRLFYTDKLREYDAGIMLMGYRITPFLMIPPHQKSHTTFAICSSECTAEGIPPEGIKIVNMLHHAHLAARRLRQRHYRNGTELAPIGVDNFYDFNYQQSHALSNEVLVLPGDELVTECDYETLDRKDVTLGGLSTTQEMCQSFMLYYPRIQLNNCGSQSELYSFFEAVGIQNVSGSVLAAMNVPYNPDSWTPEEQLLDPPDNAKEIENAEDGGSLKNIFDLIKISQPKNISHMTAGQYIRELNWKDQKYGKAVETAWRNGDHYVYCTAHGRRRIPLKNPTVPFTNIKKPYVKPVDLTCNSRQGKLSRSEGIGLRSSSIGIYVLIGVLMKLAQL